MKKLLEKLFDSNVDKETEEPVGAVEDKRVAFDGIIEIIIVSDNHSARDGLAKVLEHHAGADYFLHCGDSNLPPSDEVMKSFVTVKGNTDFREDYQDNEYVELLIGEWIWITHGHRYSVGRGIDALVKVAALTTSMAEFPSMNVVLYGHTHVVEVEMQKGILVINPGSISRPRDGIRRTYARLQITTDCYDIQIFDVADHSVIKEFQFPREYSLPNQDQR